MRMRFLLDGVLAHERTRSVAGKTSQIVAQRAATSDQAVIPAANVPLSGEEATRRHDRRVLQAAGRDQGHRGDQHDGSRSPAEPAGEPLMCSPVIVRSEDTSIVTIGNGPAVMPLMTATRTSGLILTPSRLT
jgi:hypothetical protein